MRWVVLAEAPPQTTARTEASAKAQRSPTTNATAAVGNSENFATDDAQWAEVTVVLPKGVPAIPPSPILSTMR